MSAQRSTKAGSAARTTKAGTSVTKTATGRSTQARSTSAATGGSRPTESPDNGRPSVDPESGDRRVVVAVQRDLAVLRQVSPDLADGALAASALAMAREIDNAGNSATSKSMCARALLETLDRIRELMPDEEGTDALDDLASRRATRLTGKSATAT